VDDFNKSSLYMQNLSDGALIPSCGLKLKLVQIIQVLSGDAMLARLCYGPVFVCLSVRLSVKSWSSSDYNNYIAVNPVHRSTRTGIIIIVVNYLRYTGRQFY